MSSSVEDRVCEIVADAMARDPANVQLTSNLMFDLGAESLDFLDIVFKLESAFGIQITRGEMEKAARGDMSDEEFAPGGLVSEAGLQRLRELMPIIGHIQIASIPSRNEPDGEELNYPFLFTELDRLGYGGFVGCEYNPRAATTDGLGWFKPNAGVKP